MGLLVSDSFIRPAAAASTRRGGRRVFIRGQFPGSLGLLFAELPIHVSVGIGYT